MKFKYTLCCICLIQIAWAQDVINNSIPIESETKLSAQEIKLLKKVAKERAKLEEYSGVLGTAPDRETITSAGAAMEGMPNGPDLYVYFTQTLANGIYYEARLYGKYNTNSEPTAFNVPQTAENNPNGGRVVGKLGYNFHVTSNYDITPYLRLEGGQNWALVYADTTGNNVTSNYYGVLSGFKQTFIIGNNFNPYVDIFGGVLQSSLNGVFTQGPNANMNQTATVTQYQVTNEMGVAYKISEHSAIIPYAQFIYFINNPNKLANTPYNGGGFNISALTTYQIVWALKYSYSW